jgi:hypothetical protein
MVGISKASVERIRQQVDKYVRRGWRGRHCTRWLTHGRLCALLDLPHNPQHEFELQKAWSACTGRMLDYERHVKLPSGRVVYGVYHVPVRWDVACERFAMVMHAHGIDAKP